MRRGRLVSVRLLGLLLAAGPVLIPVGCATDEAASTAPTASPLPVATPVATPTPVPATCEFGPGWDAASGAPQTYGFEPSVVSTTLPEEVALKVKAAPNVGRVELELQSGATAALTNYGRGRFCVVLSPDEVLSGYDTDHANHSFIGFLDYYSAGERTARLNGFVNVADENVPSATVRSLGPDAQASPYVFNLRLPGVPPETLLQDHLEEITQRFYSHFPDHFDFICLVSVPSITANRVNWNVRNDTRGIGMGLYDYSGRFGSNGRLMSFLRFPIGHLFDLGSPSANHEIGHRWANMLRLPALEGVLTHWPLSTLARGVIAIGPNGQGIDFPYVLVPSGGGDYRLDPAEDAQTFNDMELYLMGMVPAAEVGNHEVFRNQDQELCDGCTLQGPVNRLTIRDVIDYHGPRVPAYPDAPRTFRAGTIVVTMDRLLTAREMAFYDYFAARGEATEPLAYSAGFVRGESLPFHLATGGRGHLVTRLEP